MKDELVGIIENLEIWCNTCQKRHLFIEHYGVIELTQAIIDAGYICKDEVRLDEEKIAEIIYNNQKLGYDCYDEGSEKKLAHTIATAPDILKIKE